MKYLGITKKIFEEIRLLPLLEQVNAYDTLFDYEITGQINTKYDVVKTLIIKHKKDIDKVVAYCKLVKKIEVNKRDRKSPEYRKWRMSVFVRDNYTCQICGKVGGNLNAHHIKHFATNIDLRFDVNNGITLCYECHKELHSLTKE